MILIRFLKKKFEIFYDLGRLFADPADQNETDPQHCLNATYSGVRPTWCSWSTFCSMLEG